MAKEIILIGGGGHCKSVIDVIEQEGSYTIKGIIDVAEKVGQQVSAYNIIGTEEELPEFLEASPYAVVTVGQVRDSALRIKLFERIKKAGGQLPVIISPRAYVSPRAEIGEGSVVMHAACVNAGVKVGLNAIINSQALIEHDAVVGDYCHISTAAVINGDCQVGNEVLIGSRAALRQGVKIADKVLVGMGSVVLHDILTAGIYAGVPAHKLS
ncbi:sugar O-acyltransferase (sialic acid O-acetyltransferase NeuD family) [Catalinimonas alkaloidigena]|uniref:acetyltransferase n=1 Tax=Catalinimonas alkaloidigena TaxID=1075417 RepID=UPI00240621AF|nr:acetyltransferase [Catalinimonas alkaloidigena]MDF9795200.1 sugar O-acyltransferase (sialic acid O-acetyltransferase NeuD family) [Catalinimonas alkaloidigena]